MMEGLMELDAAAANPGPFPELRVGFAVSLEEATDIFHWAQEHGEDPEVLMKRAVMLALFT